MATKKRTPARKPAAPARRRRTMAAPARRSSTRKRSGSTSKFDLINTIVMPAAGAGIAIIAGNAISKMIPSIPFGKALIPFGLSFVAGSMLKQPALAAGMAAAGGIALLNQVSPAMFADESLEFLNEDPVPMIQFNDDMETDYFENYGELAENAGANVQYDAMNNALIQMPDGSLQYI